MGTKLQGVREGMESKFGEEKQQRRQDEEAVKKLQKTLKFETEQEIDDRIREIDMKIQTEVMKLADEKKLLAEIADLKRKRPNVSKVNAMKEQLGDRSNTEDQRSSIKDLDKQLFE